MSVPLTSLKAALQAWLTTSTSMSVVYQFQNAPEPNAPFVSVNPIASIQRVGLADELVDEVADGTTRIVPRRRILCSVQCCGAGALQALSQAQDRLEIPSLYEAWFVDREMEAHTGQLRNLTGMKNGRYEQRAQMDVIINCINSDDGDGTEFIDDLGWFDTVTYSAEIDGNNSETLILTDKSIEGD